jgi:hypothetical protein
MPTSRSARSTLPPGPPSGAARRRTARSPTSRSSSARRHGGVGCPAAVPSSRTAVRHRPPWRVEPRGSTSRRRRRRRQALGGVDVGQRQQHLEPSVCAQRGHDRFDDVGLGGRQAAQQRAPGQHDGRLVGARPQRSGERFGSGNHEQRVRAAAAATGSCGAARGLGERLGGGIESNHQRRRLAAGATQCGLAIARPNIDDHPLVAGDQAVDLTDVHLEEAAPDYLAHDGQSTAHLPAAG